MEYYTSSDDSLDNWDMTNDFNWLEAAFGRDLHDSAAALPHEVEQLSGHTKELALSQEGTYIEASVPGCIMQRTAHAVNAYDLGDDSRASHAEVAASRVPHSPSCSMMHEGVVAATVNLMPERTSGSSLAVVSAADLAQSTKNLFHSGNGQSTVRGLDTCLVGVGTPVSVANIPATTMAPDRVPRTGTNTIVCVQADDAPSGRQPAKILRCGLCMSSKLFDRRYELERHMSTHFPGQYPCTQPGCTFVGSRAFKRSDKLVKHKREAHGVRG
ncbi:hypothetical protein LTR17_005636 [Elasticomyces elasticus]|nr:hypothetical protein LTR17_005636 [Elasticomyces elasticus]